MKVLSIVLVLLLLIALVLPVAAQPGDCTVLAKQAARTYGALLAVAMFVDMPGYEVVGKVPKGTCANLSRLQRLNRDLAVELAAFLQPPDQAH